jgi:hypothetical protein
MVWVGLQRHDIEGRALGVLVTPSPKHHGLVVFGHALKLDYECAIRRLKLRAFGLQLVNVLKQLGLLIKAKLAGSAK